MADMDKTVVMVGVSAAIRGIEEELQYAARSDAKVLITGESGVGKEVVARAIHQRSARASAPLITINCAGFPDSLLESELFGHMKGSFTDASRDKRGWLELAHGGTVFMDEVGEMSLRMQALLLRFLETGEIQRVGSERPSQRLNVRVIAATNRRLLESVADKSFREDLYYRLNVIHLEVPPLRQRREDVAALMQHFLRSFAASHRMPLRQVSPAAMQCLTDYNWPGNVRELKNVSERLVLRARSGAIEVNELPAEIRAAAGPAIARTTPQPQAAVPVAQELFDRMINGGESFWSVVYEPFAARDLTRDQLRDVVRLGLEHTRGNYKMLVSCFNMAPTDYKRLLSFLRKHQCHVPFQHFRVVPARVPATTVRPRAATA
jgi:DNA-binding NtrC family response regulator